MEKTAFTLFRYLENYYSNDIDIVPLKWYTICWIGGTAYVYDSKTGLRKMGHF